MDGFVDIMIGIFNERELVVKLYKYYRPLILLAKIENDSIIFDLSNNKEIAKINTLLCDIDDDKIYYANGSKLMEFKSETKINIELTMLEYPIRYLEIIKNFIVISDQLALCIFDINTSKKILIFPEYEVDSIFINNMIVVVCTGLGAIIKYTYNLDGNLLDYVMNNFEDFYYDSDPEFVQKYKHGSVIFSSKMIIKIDEYDMHNSCTICKWQISPIATSFSVYSHGMIILTAENIDFYKFTENKLVHEKTINNTNGAILSTMYEYNLVMITDKYMQFVSILDNSIYLNLEFEEEIKSVKLNTWKDLEFPNYLQ